METKYWIQEQAPAGNYVDSIGLHGRTKKEAVKELRSWQKSFPKRVCRLIERTDKVVTQ